MPSLPACSSASTKQALTRRSAAAAAAAGTGARRRLVGGRLLRAGFQRAEHLVIPIGLQRLPRFEDAGCNLAQMTEELGRARLPGEAQRVRPASRARQGERPQAGLLQVLMENPGRTIANDVQGAG